MTPFRRWRRAFVSLSLLALFWAAFARSLGPSDLYDQTQPRTVSYTSDIILHGNWILPLERAQAPATKPPLYNWLAVPAVKLIGFGSEIAHKLPSLLAMALCWLLLVRSGRSLFCGIEQGEMIGWLAGLVFVSSYAIFKLGFLARPDMLLTLWLGLGWWVGTVLVTERLEETDRGHRAGDSSGRKITAGDTPDLPRRSSHLMLAAAFWTCTALAALTKGPAAVVLPLYAIAMTLFAAGRGQRGAVAGAFGWWWGLPAVLLVIGGWMWGVWQIDPEHVREVLWRSEIAGRVTGTGPEGAQSGPIAIITGLPDMSIYYLLRFGPWSLLSIIAIIVLWRRPGRGEPRRWRTLGRRGVVLHGAALFIILVIAIYSFSAGKRADYIASAYLPGSLLTAWWCVAERPRVALRFPWAIPLAAVVMLTVLTMINQLQPEAPGGFTEFGDEIMRFAGKSRMVMDQDERPVVFYATGSSHLQAVLGFSRREDRKELWRLVESGEPFWVFAGRRGRPPQEFDDWLRARRDLEEIRAVARSAQLPRDAGWPVQVTLWSVRGAGAGE